MGDTETANEGAAMITASTLRNPKVACGIYIAMRHAISGKPEYSRSFGGTAYVQNARGQNYIRVSWHKGEGFKFYAAADSQTKCGYEITNKVLQALRA